MAGGWVVRNDDSQTNAANNHARELAPFAPRHDRCGTKALATTAWRENGWFDVPAPAPDSAIHRRLVLCVGEVARGAGWTETRSQCRGGQEPGPGTTRLGYIATLCHR